MVTALLKEDHITYTSGDDIAVICKPLHKLGITVFNYVRTFDDGSQINLANIPKWLEFFYKNKFYQIGVFEKCPNHYNSGYALWSQLTDQEVFSAGRTYFNIDYGITIIEKQPGCCDFYYFGTTENNPTIINFYLNNLDLLKRFILYFRDKANPIINEANENRIILPDHFHKQKSTQYSEIDILNKSKDEFLKETIIKNFRLTGESEGEYISNKQLGCLVYLLEGKTAKEIAKILGISYRTVEGHINKLKARFNCHTKAELVAKLLKNGLGVYSSKGGIII